ncbi:MAG: hypothetical protein E7317_04805 [Clostridiales bacterium]|nr:hypothetical protein [Clostridiales bacterium]
MASNKHEAVWEWLMTCPYIGDMFFNASRAEDGNTQLVPSERVVHEFLDGSSERDYTVALTRFLAYSQDPNDQANIQAVVDLEAVADWVDSQNDAGSFPQFPQGSTVNEVRLLPNESGYMVAQDMTLAKYMIQFTINYTKE